MLYRFSECKVDSMPSYSPRYIRTASIKNSKAITCFSAFCYDILFHLSDIYIYIYIYCSYITYYVNV